MLLYMMKVTVTLVHVHVPVYSSTVFKHDFVCQQDTFHEFWMNLRYRAWNSVPSAGIKVIWITWQCRPEELSEIWFSMENLWKDHVDFKGLLTEACVITDGLPWWSQTLMYHFFKICNIPVSWNNLLNLWIHSSLGHTSGNFIKKNLQSPTPTHTHTHTRTHTCARTHESFFSPAVF